MKTLKEQTDAKIEQSRKAKPEFMKGVEEIIEQAKQFKKGEDAIKVGEKAPLFELPNQDNHLTSLSSLINDGPVIVTFYRGSWCPYCNLQLRALRERLGEISDLGAKLIAISPEVPDTTMDPNEISQLGFNVLSDQDAKVAKDYGVAWDVPDFLLEHMRVDRQLDLETINNGNAQVLPIPATFIINPQGEVIWNYVNVDYRTRSEPDEIIEQLKKIK